MIGPTPGHLYPALAIGHAFEATVGAVDLLLIDTATEGFGDRMASLGDARGHWRRVTVPGSTLVGGSLAIRGRALGQVLTGLLPSRRLLRQHQVRLAIGLGAYLSCAVLLAARSAGIRTAIHEANAVPGLANRLLGPIVHRVYLGFASAAHSFPASRRQIVGNPIRPSIAALASEPHPPPANGRPARILVLTSSRGGDFFARALPALASSLRRIGVDVEVRHQSGDADPEHVAAAYRSAGVPATVTPHLDDVASAYRWADFAICRGGAGTLTELGAAGLPALLVPLSAAAGDHQAANARAFASAGAGLWARESDWHDDTLAPRIAGLIRDPGSWRAASDRARSLMPSMAGARLANDCELMMQGRW